MSDMYTILINDDHSFLHTVRKRIMCRSNMIDNIRFLVNPTYGDLDMTKVNAVLEYVTPISRTYGTVVLNPSAELYHNRVEYIVPVDLKFTNEVGELELTINFSYLVLDAETETFKEQVRRIGSTSITIHNDVRWSDYIANSSLDNIAQIMLTNQSILEQQKVYAEMIAYEKADSIAKDEETNEIYLTSQGREIGARIKDSDSCADGEIPVVDFDDIKTDSDVNTGESEEKEVNNVVEF